LEKIVTENQNSQLNMEELSWHALEPEEILKQLSTPIESGLSGEEVKRRLDVYGPNQLIEAARISFWRMLWNQFNNFIIILLIVSAVISAILGDIKESAAILSIVILNAALGVIQERRAEDALSALKKLAAPEAQVVRDGRRQLILSPELVPGDIVILEAGNYVPADVRLLEAVNLRVEEAALTGESVPVQKDANIKLKADIPLGDRKNTAFMGTMISYGRGRGVVISTGMRTQIGLIARMLQSVENEPTPLQRRLDHLGKILGWGALAVCGLVFIVGWMRGNNPLDMFILAVSLAIAAVPEGLPAVVTISLALGMREMIRQHALIRRLSSVETLGSATVICSDKTGTLTQNEMSVTRLWADGKFIAVTGSSRSLAGEFLIDGKPVSIKSYPAVQTALWVGALNNDSELEITGTVEEGQTYSMAGDPTEGALVVAAAKAGALPRPLNRAYPRIDEIPFDSARKRMVTLHIIDDPQPEDISPFYDDGNRSKHVVAVKGAPDVVLELCSSYQRMNDESAPLDDAQRMRILAANDALTQDALRVLGVAYRVASGVPNIKSDGNIEQDLVFVGLIGMIDPPRPEVSAALEKARHAGIRTIMITGDYPNTARAIAESIGLLRPGHQVLAGPDLNKLDDQALQDQVAYTDVFARVSPEHKVRIVDALRARNEVVAMTGDGVNDAPSIKRADIGVAMGITGTDVAKESADMVLTDDNYSSIVAAVEQGRVIYSNIRKFVYYLLSCNVAEILIIFLGMLFNLGRVLTAIQLLWLNLITDGAPALALGTEKGDPDIMNQPPRPTREPIINRMMQVGILVQTIAITSVTLGAYLLGRHLHPSSPEFAETMGFATLSFSELFRAYTSRSERYPLLKIGIFSNRYMNLAFVFSLILLLAAIYVPFLQPIFNTTTLGLAQWEVILPLILIPSVAAEITKFVYSRTKK
jgi:P-type Ca2+ transporter type 2C